MNVQRIDHVSFTVADIERSADFYRRFGFSDVKRYISAGPNVDRGGPVCPEVRREPQMSVLYVMAASKQAPRCGARGRN